MFVKICGMTNERDALLAVALGADSVGFVFAPSPRQVAPSVAADIAKRLPPEIVTVGVFRDESPRRVVEIVNRSGLKAAQLHGHEAPDAVRYVYDRVPLTIKAFPAGHPEVARARDYGVDVILLDGPSPGSGKVFDWRIADGAAGQARLVLSGGLDAENVGEAIAAVRPWGVDVATGVELAPGHKDPERLRAFIEAARGAESPPYEGPGDAPYDWQDEW